MEKVKNVVLPNFLSQDKIVTFIELYFLLKSKNMPLQKEKQRIKSIRQYHCMSHGLIFFPKLHSLFLVIKKQVHMDRSVKVRIKQYNQYFCYHNVVG